MLLGRADTLKPPGSIGGGTSLRRAARRVEGPDRGPWESESLVWVAPDPVTVKREKGGEGGVQLVQVPIESALFVARFALVSSLMIHECAPGAFDYTVQRKKFVASGPSVAPGARRRP